MKDFCKMPRNKPFLNIKVSLFKISNPDCVRVKHRTDWQIKFVNFQNSAPLTGNQLLDLVAIVVEDEVLVVEVDLTVCKVEQLKFNFNFDD